MFEKEIEYNFTKNSLLFVKNNMYYKYDNLSEDYHRLQHEYNIYDDENNLIHKYLFNKDTYYDESLDLILHTNEDFCICFRKNYKKIKINLQLHRHNRHGVGNINLEIDDDNENYINIDYLDRNNDNNEKVDTNTESISTNLGKINTNVADISSNLGKIDNNITAIKLIDKNSKDNSKNISSNKGLINTNTSNISSNKGLISTNASNISSNLNEINNVKNNFNKVHLKNVYNILIYDKKTQIDFTNIFYEKIFNVNAKQNDFLEIAFKIEIEYLDKDSIINRDYLEMICELFDENDNSLYIKSVNLDNYKYRSLSMIIDIDIFYCFIKDVKKLKFVVEFKKIEPGRITISYIKNDNLRLILKHFGN